MSTIIYSSGFIDGVNHGGGHRWMQLEELIKQTKIPAQPLRLPDSFSKKEKLAGIAWLVSKGFLKGRPRRSWVYIGGLFENLCERFKARQPRLLLTETLDMNGCVLAAVAHRLSIPLVICPPNLDSLLHPFELHDIFSPPSTSKHFSAEFAWLSLADAVFTISAEEAFVLNNVGIPAHFLPYFPASATAASLQKFRNERLPHDFYLLLGSAVNPPTKQGLLHQLDFLKEALGPNESAIVVGRGTGEITCDSPQVTIEGEVSNERLGELLQTCKAAWIHQTQGVGALTRISEILLAGVPIVASAHAARSAPYEGLFAYEDFGYALELLRGELPAKASAPEILAHPVDFFQNTLHYLCR